MTPPPPERRAKADATEPSQPPPAPGVTDPPRPPLTMPLALVAARRPETDLPAKSLPQELTRFTQPSPPPRDPVAALYAATHPRGAVRADQATRVETAVLAALSALRRTVAGPYAEDHRHAVPLALVPAPHVRNTTPVGRGTRVAAGLSSPPRTVAARHGRRAVPALPYDEGDV